MNRCLRLKWMKLISEGLGAPEGYGFSPTTSGVKVSGFMVRRGRGCPCG